MTVRLDPEVAAIVGDAVDRRLTASEALDAAASIRAVVDALPARTPAEKRLDGRLRAAAAVLSAQATNARRRLT